MVRLGVPDNAVHVAEDVDVAPIKLLLAIINAVPVIMKNRSDTIHGALESVEPFRGRDYKNASAFKLGDHISLDKILAELIIMDDWPTIFIGGGLIKWMAIGSKNRSVCARKYKKSGPN